MKKGIVTSIAFATVVTGSLFLAANFGPACDRLLAADEGIAPTPQQWIIRAAMAPEREGVKIASIQLAGFEVGQVVIPDRPPMNAPEQVTDWCDRRARARR